MRVLISVPGSDLDSRLRDAASRMWEDLGRVAANPLGPVEVSFQAGATEPDAIAWSRPLYGVSDGVGLGDRALIVPSTQLLTTASEEEKRLTLLHECIHMRLAFREYRERWRRIQDLLRAHRSAAREAAWRDIDLANYMERRSQHAYTLLTLPDEILAEQFLRRDYGEFFPSRAAYYTRMRRAREVEKGDTQPDVELLPFRLYYEALRSSFFIPLVADMVPLEGELERLEKVAEARLAESGPEDLLEFLREVKPKLLSVSLEDLTSDTEAAYDRVFERVIATERRTVTKSDTVAE
jgi:hypothetical protein